MLEVFFFNDVLRYESEINDGVERCQILAATFIILSCIVLISVVNYIVRKTENLFNDSVMFLEIICRTSILGNIIFIVR